MTLELIASDGVDSFSLREVARKAGVSTRAPYQHFENKAALLAEIARAGYVLLRDALREAAEPARTRGQALKRMFDAYVAFSQRHHSHFQVMFRPALYDQPNHPEVAAAGDQAMAVLVDQLARFKRGARSNPTPERLAALAWATAHGTASLLHDGAWQHRSAVLGRTQSELVGEISGSFGQLLEP